MGAKGAATKVEFPEKAPQMIPIDDFFPYELQKMKRDDPAAQGSVFVFGRQEQCDRQGDSALLQCAMTASPQP
jgi:hypothetical protein